MKDYIQFRLSKLSLKSGKSQLVDLVLDLYKELNDHEFTREEAQKMIREVLLTQIKQYTIMLQYLKNKDD